MGLTGRAADALRGHVVRKALVRRLSRRHYGGGRAMLAYWLRYCYWLLGGYREYRKIRWSQVRRLVFVCHGNICRSPYAEYWAKARGLPSASLGVDTVGDQGANVLASRVAEYRTICLEDHRTTPIGRFEAEEGDLLIAMEPAHLDAVERRPWTAPHQITLLGLWIDSHGAVISDPYGLDEEFFGDCFSLIEAGIGNIEDQWRRSRLDGYRGW